MHDCMHMMSDSSAILCTAIVAALLLCLGCDRGKPNPARSLAFAPPVSAGAGTSRYLINTSFEDGTISPFTSGAFGGNCASVVAAQEGIPAHSGVRVARCHIPNGHAARLEFTYHDNPPLSSNGLYQSWWIYLPAGFNSRQGGGLKLHLSRGTRAWTQIGYGDSPPQVQIGSDALPDAEPWKYTGVSLPESRWLRIKTWYHVRPTGRADVRVWFDLGRGLKKLYEVLDDKDTRVWGGTGQTEEVGFWLGYVWTDSARMPQTMYVDDVQACDCDIP